MNTFPVGRNRKLEPIQLAQIGALSTLTCTPAHGRGCEKFNTKILVRICIARFLNHATIFPIYLENMVTSTVGQPKNMSHKKTTRKVLTFHGRSHPNLSHHSGSHRGVFPVACDGARLEPAAPKPTPSSADLPPGVPDPLGCPAPSSPGDRAVAPFDDIKEFLRDLLSLSQSPMRSF